MPQLDVKQAARLLGVKVCRAGLHPMTPDNIYRRPGRSAEWCLACKTTKESTHYAVNRDRRMGQRAGLLATDRELVFGHYGWSCRCCSEGDERFLTLDHRNGDGSEERSRDGKRVYLNTIRATARVFRETGVWRDDLQTLCVYCNLRKGKGPRCPCGARDELPGQLALWELVSPA